MAFPETKWTMLARATLNGDEAGRAALDELCRRYWPAVRDTLLARGYTTQDAEDICQDFFASLLKSSSWHHADQAKGKFRSYLMGALENTIVQRRRWNTRQKRGQGVPDLNLDDIPEPVVMEDERRFDTAWAERVLEMALDALEREMSESGRGAEFSALARFLGASADVASSSMVAEELGLSAPALRSKIFRLRQQFREGILAEISRTVETPHEAEQEMAYLFEVVSQPGFSLAAICETAEPL